MVELKFKCSTVFAALFVRAILILHNCLTVWRVVISHGNSTFWGLAAGNVLSVVEGVLVIRYNGGTEWNWWSPCFLVYLVTTLPGIWLLQLSQYDALVASQESPNYEQPTYNDRLVSTAMPDLNLTTAMAATMSSTTDVTGTTKVLFETLFELEDNTWIVVIQESLVYLLVFGRWILPRSGVSREALSDLLLQFLAIASDIMELYAIFDEEIVQSNLRITYAILSLWSLSFLQFIPVLVYKHKYRHLHSPRMQRITRACGDYFAEVLITCTSIILQDGPFLCLRLYIMIELKLVNYSLVFFVLKNIVSVLILLYRLHIMCIQLPCCYHDDKEMVKVETVDFSAPAVFNSTQKLHMHIKESAPNSELQP